MWGGGKRYHCGENWKLGFVTKDIRIIFSKSFFWNLSYWNIKGKGQERKIFSVLFCKAGHREAGMTCRRYSQENGLKSSNPLVLSLISLSKVSMEVSRQVSWTTKIICLRFSAALDWRLWWARTAYYKIKDTAQWCFLYVLKQDVMLITKLLNLILKNKTPVDRTRCLNADESASWECEEARRLFTTLGF